MGDDRPFEGDGGAAETEIAAGRFLDAAGEGGGGRLKCEAVELIAAGDGLQP